MDDDVRISWENFLNPEILRTKLIVASLFITAFEILKGCIIGHIRDFFTNGFNENGLIVNEKYKIEVLNRNKSQLYASLAWLKDMNVINSDDIEKFDKIKQCRNELAHEMTKFITKRPKNDPLPLFSEIIDLLHKIEKWWILNVEIPTDPDLNDREINEEGIITESMITLRLLFDIALGSEEESKFYYNEFIKRKKDI